MQLRIRVIRFFRRVSQHVRKLSSVGAAPYSDEDPEQGGETAPPVKPGGKPSPGLSTVHEHKDGSSGMVRVPDPKPCGKAQHRALARPLHHA